MVPPFAAKHTVTLKGKPSADQGLQIIRKGRAKRPTSICSINDDRFIDNFPDVIYEVQGAKHDNQSSLPFFCRTLPCRYMSASNAVSMHRVPYFGLVTRRRSCKRTQFSSLACSGTGTEIEGGHTVFAAVNTPDVFQRAGGPSLIIDQASSHLSSLTCMANPYRES